MRPMLRSWIRSGRPWPFVLAALVACNGDPGTAPQVATSIADPFCGSFLSMCSATRSRESEN